MDDLHEVELSWYVILKLMSACAHLLLSGPMVMLRT